MNRNLTEVVFILDRIGSMMGLRRVSLTLMGLTRCFLPLGLSRLQGIPLDLKKMS